MALHIDMLKNIQASRWLLYGKENSRIGILSASYIILLTLAKSSASALVTVRRWRRSDLLPTTVQQASGSAWLRHSLQNADVQG
jgi:hypothetical protein